MNTPLTTERADVSSDLQWVHAQLEEIVTASVRVQVAQENLARAEALARDHLEDSRSVSCCFGWKGIGGLERRDGRAVGNLASRMPRRLADRALLRDATGQGTASGRGLVLVDRHLPASSENPSRLFSRAKLLSDIRAHEQSDQLFRRLILEHTDRNIRVEFAKRLRKRGLLADAYEAIRPVAAHLAPGSKAAELATALAADYAFFKGLEPEGGLAGKDVRIVSMKHAILHFRNRKIAEQPPEKPVSVALVTGSLGLAAPSAS